MESNSEPGKVNISGSTFERVKDHFSCVPRGRVEAKGIGEVDMYFAEYSKSQPESLPG
jgi:class 3 adenylate cyclase